MATDYSSWLALSDYDKQHLSAAQQSDVLAQKQAAVAAHQSGNTAAQRAANEAANAIRANSASGVSYSGGAQGNQYNVLGQTQTYSPAAVATANDGSDYLRAATDAYNAAAKQALQSAYDQTMLEHNAAAAKIPGVYQDARNQTAASGELARMNFNEYAAASGLNSGAAGQQQLAMSNTLQGNMGAINKAQGNAMSDLELERLKIEKDYQNGVAQAIADGNLQLARQLYDEFVRVDNAKIQTAQAQADENYRAWAANSQNWMGNRDYYTGLGQLSGDYSGLGTYGVPNSQIAALQNAWQIANAPKPTGGGGGGGGGNIQTSAPAYTGGTYFQDMTQMSDGYSSVWNSARNQFDAGRTSADIKTFLSAQLSQGRISGAEAERILDSLGL